jgi:hypothetical protein
VDYPGIVAIIPNTVEDRAVDYPRMEIGVYPNPFNPGAEICFHLIQSDLVNIDIFDVQGRLVKSLMDEEKITGFYNIKWEGDTGAGGRAHSGIYFVRLRIGERTETVKVLKIN